VGIIPFLVLSFYVSEILALVMFIFACVTDYADGYIAKRFNQSSRFGAFLDPIADKLLVSTALLMMAGMGQIRGFHLIPASIVLCREFFISGLREFLAASGKELRVSNIAKYKTTLQMTAITCLLTNVNVSWFAGNVLLWASAALSVVTGAHYLKAVIDSQ
jgi:CDP-diacylglycerol--glycerol-3-phosphate 3-phosphatidyltransferase